jgi:hypothetical protein
MPAIQPASSASLGARQSTTSGPLPAGARAASIVLSMLPGMVAEKVLATSMIPGRLRRLVVISKVATAG